MVQEFMVARFDELIDRQFKVFQVGGRQVGLARMGENEVCAVLNYCPHGGAPVCMGKVGGTTLPCDPGSMLFGLEGRILKCPWHGYEFDLVTGKAVFNESNLRLFRFETSVRDGMVYVKV